MRKSKKMSVFVGSVAVALVLGMFALAGCGSSTSNNTTTNNTASDNTASNNTSSNNTASNSTSDSTTYTQADVEAECAGSCHSTSTVDAWTSQDVTASTAKSMVSSLSNDQAAAIAAFYASK
jgi:hypothetical protein